MLEDDDLAEMVNAGLLPWAVVDDYKIQWWDDDIHQTGGQGRYRVPLRRARMAWAFRKGSPELEKAVNDFLKKNREGTLVGNVS